MKMLCYEAYCICNDTYASSNNRELFIELGIYHSSLANEYHWLCYISIANTASRPDPYTYLWIVNTVDWTVLAFQSISNNIFVQEISPLLSKSRTDAEGSAEATISVNRSYFSSLQIKPYLRSLAYFRGLPPSLWVETSVHNNQSFVKLRLQRYKRQIVRLIFEWILEFSSNFMKTAKTQYCEKV